MLYYQRKLPHWVPDSAIIFITWRLAGSVPPSSPEILTAENTGRVSFAEKDRILDRMREGPFWLRDGRIAQIVEDALHYGENPLGLYTLYAWVIMPNHVHVVFQPKAALPDIMRWLKGRSGRVANRILGRTGKPFWQDESYDHWIRSTQELDEIIDYVETNPVSAGLVHSAEQWLWSSAGKAADDILRSSAPPFISGR
jgi:putative transposase